MTDNVPRLPNWPPLDGKISVDEARQIIVWIREHAGPVLEEAERMLRERYPGAEIGRSAMTVEHLAKWGGPTPNMMGCRSAVSGASTWPAALRWWISCSTGRDGS